MTALNDLPSNRSEFFLHVYGLTLKQKQEMIDSLTLDSLGNCNFLARFCPKTDDSVLDDYGMLDEWRREHWGVDEDLMHVDIPSSTEGGPFYFAFLTFCGEAPIAGLIEISKSFPDATFLLKGNNVEYDCCFVVACQNGIALREVFQFSPLVKHWMNWKRTSSSEIDFHDHLEDEDDEEVLSEWARQYHYYDIIDWIIEPVGELLASLVQVTNSANSTVEYLIGSHSIKIGCERITSGYVPFRDEDFERHQFLPLKTTA
jgi:hypothetical protein